LAFIENAKPQDEIESALVMQMACTHAAAMAVLATFAGAGGGDRSMVAKASAAARLLRAYTAQVEVLRRLRSGGSQLVRVEHPPFEHGMTWTAHYFDPRSNREGVSRAFSSQDRRPIPASDHCDLRPSGIRSSRSPAKAASMSAARPAWKITVFFRPHGINVPMQRQTTGQTGRTRTLLTTEKGERSALPYYF
jgi:hypothetical protein